MEKTNTITKRMVLAAIKAIVETDSELTVDVDDIVITSADIEKYVDETIAAIDRKNEKAREAFAKKAGIDDLMQTVYEAVTDAPQTGEQITATIGIEGLTKSKVVSRLTKLVNEGSIVKELKTTDKRKIQTYRLPAATEPTDAE